MCLSGVASALARHERVFGVRGGEGEGGAAIQPSPGSRHEAKDPSLTIPTLMASRSLLPSLLVR